MDTFDRKSLSELRKMTLKEVEKYYLELRKYEYDNNIPLKHIELRKKIHFLLLQLVKIDRILSHETLTVIGDEREKSDAPKIYACTHIGGNDIQRTFEAIKDHAYLFIGDPRELYVDITGVILKLNGAIALDTKDSDDRHIAYERSVELLNRGGNLLIYPEGAWNITPNLPSMMLYKGAVRMSKETQADIIPVALEQYDNDFYANIGKNIKYDPSKDVDTVNFELRDAMASLKWKIWENHTGNREEFDDDYNDRFVDTIINRCEYGFTKEDVYHDMYKDENITLPEEAYIVTPKEEFEMRKKLSRGYY